VEVSISYRSFLAFRCSAAGRLGTGSSHAVHALEHDPLLPFKISGVYTLVT